MNEITDFLRYCRQLVAADPDTCPWKASDVARLLAWQEVAARRFDLERRMTMQAVEAERDRTRSLMAEQYRAELVAPTGSAPAPVEA
jgi:hypothetical protein